MVPQLRDTKYGAIIAAVVGRVQTITRANGYRFNVKPSSVVSDPANPFTVDESALPWFLVEVDKGASRAWHPANEIEETFPMLMTGRLMATGTSPLRKMTVAIHAYGDLEKAFAADLTLGGLVIDLRCQPIQPPPIPGFSDDQNVFVLMQLQARYLRQHGQP